MSRDNSTPLRGVGCFRMSSDDQEGSIEQQQEWARTTAPKENVEIVVEFVDSAISGADTARRADFHRMLDFCRAEHAKRRPIDVIVCWNPNRFSRADSQETGWFIWEFRKVGTSLMLTASDGWIDFADDNHRLVFNIKQDTTNHKFLKSLSQDVLRGKLEAAKDGRWNGGRPPLGYRLAFTVEQTPTGRQVRKSLLVIDPETAPLVREMFRSYAAGEVSLYTLAQRLNARGVKPPRAEKWTPTSIRSILRNEVYLGEYVWNRTDQAKFFGVVDLKVTAKAGGKRSHGACNRRPREHQVRHPEHHEALIDRETFDAVQRNLVDNRKGVRTRRGTFVLKSLLHCAHCGASMVGKTVSWGARAQMYRCRTYNALGKEACHSNEVYEAPLRDCIVRKLQAGLLNPEKLAELREEMLAQLEENSPASAAEEARLKREKAALEKKLARASERYLTEEDEAAAKAHQATFNAILAQKKDAEKALTAFAVRAADRPDVEKVISRAMGMMHRLDAALAAADPEALRPVLRDLVDRVDLYFRHEAKDAKTFCTFARGVIWVRPGVLRDVSSEACRDPEPLASSPCQPVTSSGQC